MMATETGNRQPRNIAVIGGGAAGTLAALQLTGQSGIGQITMFDRGGQFGRGLAYSAQASWHRLNVPATKMGGRDDEDPAGFVSWLADRGITSGPDYTNAFVARRLYGDYLCDLLAPLLASGAVATRQASVHAVEFRDGSFRIVTDKGDATTADAVILCPGNQPPSGFASIEPSVRYIDNVWAPRALESIGADEDVLVVGMGATAVDVVLDLVHRGRARNITMVSRHGILPLADVEPVSDEHPVTPANMTLRSVVRALRADVQRKAAQGISWQAVIDAFRPAVASYWRDMPETERRMFLRHLRSIWLVHRHRLAPDVAALLAELRQTGRLRTIAGRLKAAKAMPGGYDVTLTPRGSSNPTTLKTHWVLNCTGPDERYDRIDDPLLRSLFAAGRVRPGPLGLGLDVDSNCRLLNSTGAAQPGIYLIGSATRGCFWEVTAVPSIRAQAITVARNLAGF